MRIKEDMTDLEAVELLEGLAHYFERYQSTTDAASEVTCAEVAGDLFTSLARVAHSTEVRLRERLEAVGLL